MGPEKRWTEAHLDLPRSVFYPRVAVKRQEYLEMARESLGARAGGDFQSVNGKRPSETGGPSNESKVPALSTPSRSVQGGPPSQSCPNGVCIGGDNNGSAKVTNYNGICRVGTIPIGSSRCFPTGSGQAGQVDRAPTRGQSEDAALGRTPLRGREEGPGRKNLRAQPPLGRCAL
jgi:hypothetical protein